MDEKFLKEIEMMAKSIREDQELEESSEPSLKSLYEAVLLQRRRTEQKIRQLTQAARERDSFCADIQKIRAEHHMAEKIQRSLLPGDFQKCMEAFPVEIYADMDTAWEVGGDYYDFFGIDDRYFFFCIADVSGKSVSAAMFSVIVKTIVGIYIAEGKDIAQVCEEVSRQLYQKQNGGSHMFVTLWAGVLDTVTGQIEYVNAGHDAPVLIRKNGELEMLEENSGLPLAAYFNKKRPEKSKYKKHQIDLHEGDMLFLYTDGLTDSENREGVRFGSEKVMNALERCEAAQRSVREYVQYLQRTIVTYASHNHREDDITVLGIRYLGGMEGQKDVQGE
ncbi:MAG: serine/threonine-protein phosphatase [Lachnospiraceae bacterium]|nr:serine/threonine-protein phosphatase [Lachnospiraceae bacterium]